MEVAFPPHADIAIKEQKMSGNPAKSLLEKGNRLVGTFFLGEVI
jgi:hypothetical protein